MAEHDTEKKDEAGKPERTGQVSPPKPPRPEPKPEKQDD